MLKSFWNLLRNKHKAGDAIYGERIFLKPLETTDVNAFTKLLLNNRDYWSKYEPRHADSYYTTFTQYQKLVESSRLRAMNMEYFFGIYLISTNELIGQVSLYSIKKLPFLSCFVGYALDEKYAGQGITSEAVKLAVNFAFTFLQVNRIEAYVSPKNIGSVKVLEKCGFEKEGLLRQLLYINGNWEDHYIYAITYDQYKKRVRN